jgi:hypothetical protein
LVDKDLVVLPGILLFACRHIFGCVWGGGMISCLYAVGFIAFYSCRPTFPFCCCIAGCHVLGQQFIQVICRLGAGIELVRILILVDDHESADGTRKG